MWCDVTSRSFTPRCRTMYSHSSVFLFHNTMQAFACISRWHCAHAIIMSCLPTLPFMQTPRTLFVNIAWVSHHRVTLPGPRLSICEHASVIPCKSIFKNRLPHRLVSVPASQARCTKSEGVFKKSENLNDFFRSGLPNIYESDPCVF